MEHKFGEVTEDSFPSANVAEAQEAITETYIYPIWSHGVGICTSVAVYIASAMGYS